MKIEVYAERAGVSFHAGTIETTPGAGESFAYCSGWLSDPAARPLSVTLPLRPEPFPAKKMRPYFEGLLPEEGARRAIASRIHVSYAAYVKILDAVGRECIGAVSLQGPGEAPEDGYSKVDDGMLERLATQGYPVAAATSERARFSLAGSQAKIALYRGPDGVWYEPSGLAPSTHILKPATGRYEDAATNEAVCTIAAAKLGISAPRVELLDAGRPIVCTTRFDRDFSSSVRQIDGMPVPARLHQEDFCQATGTVPEHKYEEGGIRYLDKVVMLLGDVSTDPISDLWKLWDIVAFNYLIGNCDAHLKNIALLRDASWRELRLAPAYDLVCTAAYGDLSRRMAMSIGRAHSLDDVDMSSFGWLAESMRVPKSHAMARLSKLASSVEAAVEQALSDVEAGGIRCGELGELILHVTRENVRRL